MDSDKLLPVGGESGRDEAYWQSRRRFLGVVGKVVVLGATGVVGFSMGASACPVHECKPPLGPDKCSDHTCGTNNCTNHECTNTDICSTSNVCQTRDQCAVDACHNSHQCSGTDNCSVTYGHTCDPTVSHVRVP